MFCRAYSAISGWRVDVSSHGVDARMSMDNADREIALGEGLQHAEWVYQEAKSGGACRES
jgi:hypothetical protein